MDITLTGLVLGLLFLAVIVIGGISILFGLLWIVADVLTHKARTECPNCYKQAKEYERRVVGFKHQELPSNSQPVEGSHIVARIREDVEISFSCKKCQTHFTKTIMQTR